MYADMILLQAFQNEGLHLKDEKLFMEEAKTTNIMAAYAGLVLKATGEGTHANEFINTGYFVTEKLAVVGMTNVVASVLPVIVLAIVANNVTGAILGDNIDTCAIAIREILLHNTFLIARGVEIEEFYHLHEDYNLNK